MLSSLENLKKTVSDEVISQIQSEIDKNYLPRPRFSDGKPVDFGDKFRLHYSDEVQQVDNIQFFPGGIFYINNVCFSLDEKVMKSEETQDDINRDGKLDPKDYCKKYGLSEKNSVEGMITHLLKRQRDLDNREEQKC